jgi:hypothetical protein
MITDDDDLDDDDFDLLDDGDDDEAAERTNTLTVPARPPRAEMVNQFEVQFRRQGFPPVQFLETDDTTGAEIFGNAAEFGKLMNMPPDILPTMAEADRWIASQTWPSLEWD